MRSLICTSIPAVCFTSSNYPFITTSSHANFGGIAEIQIGMPSQTSPRQKKLTVSLLYDDQKISLTAFTLFEVLSDNYHHGLVWLYSISVPDLEYLSSQPEIAILKFEVELQQCCQSELFVDQIEVFRAN